MLSWSETLLDPGPLLDQKNFPHNHNAHVTIQAYIREFRVQSSELFTDPLAVHYGQQFENLNKLLQTLRERKSALLLFVPPTVLFFPSIIPPTVMEWLCILC